MTKVINPKCTDKHIADYLRKSRLNHKLSCKDFALAAKIHPNTYRNYENNKRSIKAVDLFNIAKYLDVPVSDFFPHSKIYDLIQVTNKEKILLNELHLIHSDLRTDAIEILINIVKLIRNKLQPGDFSSKKH